MAADRPSKLTSRLASPARNAGISTSTKRCPNKALVSTQDSCPQSADWGRAITRTPTVNPRPADPPRPDRHLGHYPDARDGRMGRSYESSRFRALLAKRGGGRTRRARRRASSVRPHPGSARRRRSLQRSSGNDTVSLFGLQNGCKPGCSEAPDFSSGASDLLFLGGGGGI